MFAVHASAEIRTLFQQIKFSNIQSGFLLEKYSYSPVSSPIEFRYAEGLSGAICVVHL